MYIHAHTHQLQQKILYMYTMYTYNYVVVNFARYMATHCIFGAKLQSCDVCTRFSLSTEGPPSTPLPSTTSVSPVSVSTTPPSECVLCIPLTG